MSDGVDRDRLSLDAETMRALGYRVVDRLVERWAGLAEAPIPPQERRSTVLGRLAEPLPRGGRPPAAVFERAFREVLAAAAPTGHPRFFGFIPSPSNFVAVLADALAAGFNPFLGNYMEAPGPHVLEEVTLGWLREACGLPEGAGGLFTSGGSMANLTGLAAAREARGPGRVYVSSQTHASVAKAVKLLGLGEPVVIEADERFRMRLDRLDEALAADEGQPRMAVVATAGTTNTGAVDPLGAIADRCARAGVWLHVDGAYGGAAVFGEGSAARVAGIERADSLSLDPHKWLFTPYECGCALVRDRAHLRRAFDARADYLSDVRGDDEGHVDFQDVGFQLTRSFRALKVWATFQVFGADAIAAAIETGVAHAEHMGRWIEARPGWALAAPPSLGVVAFRFVEGASEAELDDLNFGLVRRLEATGRAFVSSTLLGGRRWLRACPISPRTTVADLEETLEALDRLARQGM